MRERLRMRAVSQGGFTLLEILISMMIIGIGFCGILGVVYKGKNLLKQADNKQKAMQTASLIMENNLAKSYISLSSSSGTRCLSSDWESNNETEDSCLSRGGVPFSWNVNVSQKQVNNIPYKEIETIVSYKENGIKKAVRLVNMHPYPYIHIETQDMDPGGHISTDYQTVAAINVDFPVRKDIEVSYNIAIKVDDAEGMKADNIILTRCLIDGDPKPIETGTPLLQPLINNWVTIDDVSPGPHTISIEWRKNTEAGDIELKMGNIVLIAVEG